MKTNIVIDISPPIIYMLFLSFELWAKMLSANQITDKISQERSE